MGNDLGLSPCERIRSGAVPDDRPFVAVAVSLSRRRNQWHAGLVYCDAESSAPRLLHLAGDRELVDEPIDAESLGWDHRFLWMEVQAPMPKRRALAQICRRVGERVIELGQVVRYAVRHYIGRFNQDTGAYEPGNGELGLTCATTVLAVCRGVGLELVDVAAWPSRDEDAAWIEGVVAYLRGRDPTFATAVANDGLCPRFRPHEVAGASLSPTGKVPLAGALAAAELVVRRYDELFPASE